MNLKGDPTEWVVVTLGDPLFWVCAVLCRPCSPLYSTVVLVLCTAEISTKKGRGYASDTGTKHQQASKRSRDDTRLDCWCFIRPHRIFKSLYSQTHRKHSTHVPFHFPTITVLTLLSEELLGGNQ